MTPEGRIKNKIKKVLDKYRDGTLYTYMPVPGGFGEPTLDYLGVFRGRPFAIEAKRPGLKPTLRQEGTIAKLLKAGAAVFVIDGDPDLLDLWLAHVVNSTTVI